jgi:hypothetical protein
MLPDFSTSLVLAILFVLAFQAVKGRGLGKRFDNWATHRVEGALLKGHKRRANMLDGVRRGLVNAAWALYDVVLAAVVIGAFAVVLSVIGPDLRDAMQNVADYYWPHLLEFVSLLVTASSVLLGFAFAAEALLTARPGNGVSSRLQSHAHNAKLLGLACVIASMGALLFNGNGDLMRAKVALQIAILLLVCEAGYVALFTA